MNQLKHLAWANIASAITFDIFVLTRLCKYYQLLYITSFWYNAATVLLIVAIGIMRILRTRIDESLIPQASKTIGKVTIALLIPLTLITGVGFIFKIQHWTGGSLLFLIAMLGWLFTVPILNIINAQALLKHYKFLSSNQL